MSAWATGGSMAYLLNWAPRSWATREIMVLRLVEALRARGTSVVLVFSESPPPALARPLEMAGARLECVNFDAPRTRVARSLREIFRRHNVQTVHLRFFTHYTDLSWLVRALGVRRLVLTDPESGLLGDSSWKRIALRCRSRLMTAPLDHLIAISCFVKERLAQLGIAKARVSVVPNAIEVQRFAPDASTRATWAPTRAIDARATLLGTAAALVHFKRIPVLIRTLSVLRETGVDAHLLVAGEGPLRRPLEELATTCGVASFTHWLGHLDDVRPLLQACDVFVLASEGEAFGNVLLEAMACECPIVATRSGAIPEVVRDGETGFLVPPASPATFAAAVRTLTETPELRQRLGAAGRLHVEKTFSTERFVHETLAVYDRVWA